MTYEQIQYYRSKVFLQRIAKYKRMDTRECHEWMKKEYFGGSTTLLSNMEFEEIAKKIRMDFSKVGVYIPLPNEEDLTPNYNR